jgi:hypothetical protein
MNFSYKIARGTFPDGIPQGFVESSGRTIPVVQDEIEGRGFMTMATSFPIFQSITP